MIRQTVLTRRLTDVFFNAACAKGALHVGSADLDHFSVSLADGKLIAADGDLHRIAQGSDLLHLDRNAFGDAHVHDAALDRALAVELLDRAGAADRNISECFHILTSSYKCMDTSLIPPFMDA